MFVNNTAFVDEKYGDDTTGLYERADRPFATIAAASAAIQPGGDTIYIRDGRYDVSCVLPDGYKVTFVADE